MIKQILLLMLGIAMLSSFASSEIIWGNETSTSFEVTRATPVCEDSKFWVSWGLGGEERISSLESCFREDGYPSTTCCPESSSCVIDYSSANFGKCLGGIAPSFCADYLTANECERFNTNVAKRTIDRMTGKIDFCGSHRDSRVDSSGRTCYSLIDSCRCVWDSATNSCSANFTKTNEVCQNSENSGSSGECIFSTINREDNCQSTGYVAYSWTASWTGTGDKPLECNAGETQFPCIGSAQLSFFTDAAVVIAILVIVIFYLIVLKKKKKYSLKETGKTKTRYLNKKKQQSIKKKGGK